MKATKHILLAACLLSVLASCDTDVERDVIQHPYTYDDLYYQNLRDYKQSDHSIAFAWFAQYGSQNSAAIRFTGLPDSLDICSMWGGVPAKENTEIWEDIRFVQKVKGTRMLMVSITRMEAETDDHDFKQAFNAAQQMADGPEKDAALNRSVEMYAEYYLDQIFDNDLDGFDADYEPGTDFLRGDHFTYFLRHLAKYMGPNPGQTREERLQLIRERYGDEVASRPGICDKLLCMDCPGMYSIEVAEILDYYFLQTYLGSAQGNQASESICGGWPIEKIVFTTNLGDNWASSMSVMYQHAAWQPTDGRRKGGFGTFFVHRDYKVHDTNSEPYKRFRECIQIQNPAIHK